MRALLAWFGVLTAGALALFIVHPSVNTGAALIQMAGTLALVWWVGRGGGRP